MGLLINVLMHHPSYNSFLGPYKLPVLSTGAQLIFLDFLDWISYPVLRFLRGLVLLLSLALCKGDICCLSQGLNFIGFDLWVDPQHN